MAILSGLCVSAKLAWLESMKGDTFKIALYGASAILSEFTESYTPAGEVAGQGYKAGGMILRGIQIGVDGRTACMTFDTPIWQNATINARGAMIYNASLNNIAVVVADFGKDVISTNGNWKLPMPALGADTAVVRLS